MRRASDVWMAQSALKSFPGDLTVAEWNESEQASLEYLLAREPFPCDIDSNPSLSVAELFHSDSAYTVRSAKLISNRYRRC